MEFEKNKPEIVSFKNRFTMLFFDFFSSAILGIVLSNLLLKLNIDDGLTLFILSPFIGIFIIPLFFKGKTLFMFLYNIELIDTNTIQKISLKKIILRHLLRIIHCIPIIPLFWVFRYKNNAWYDEILGIQMIWSNSKKTSHPE